MATRFPRSLSSNSAISAVFPEEVWFAIGFSVGILAIFISVTIQVYEAVNPSMVRANLDISQILIRLLAGFTEPDDEGYFKTYSTGYNVTLRTTLKMCTINHLLGRFLMFVWFLSSFFLASLFSMDLRSIMISPLMEEPVEGVSDIPNYGKTKAMLAFGKCNINITQL